MREPLGPLADGPGFIPGGTEEIWAGCEIRSLRWTYAPSPIVRSPAPVVAAGAGVLADPATLAEFPRHEPLGEDVIGCGARESSGAGGTPPSPPTGP